MADTSRIPFMTPLQKKQFIQTVYEYYRAYGRHDLPWRPPRLKLKRPNAILDPYAIAVSEVMLQQTQVVRVIEKYYAYMSAFPTVVALARAPLADVLRLWIGLGYNRRAKFLKQAAEAVVQQHQGIFPHTTIELEQLPGIGPYTARAIATFAYNQPHLFIETNIRTVYLHHFFADTAEPVHDSDLLPLIEATLDKTSPRQWYWALMDYGSFLKSQGVRIHRKSKHYTKQSKFDGSRRQVRGMILKLLSDKPYTRVALHHATHTAVLLLEPVLSDLIQEGFVLKKGRSYMLVNDN